ncbi:hypothetical protein ABFS82_14G268600 [Erythranthe guttata]
MMRPGYKAYPQGWIGVKLGYRAIPPDWIGVPLQAAFLYDVPTPPHFEVPVSAVIHKPQVVLPGESIPRGWHPMPRSPPSLPPPSKIPKFKVIPMWQLVKTTPDDYRMIFWFYFLSGGKE